MPKIASFTFQLPMKTSIDVATPLINQMPIRRNLKLNTFLLCYGAKRGEQVIRVVPKILSSRFPP